MSEHTPYEPPGSGQEPDQVPDEPQITLRSPRVVSVSRGLTWIVEAFGLFKRYPIPWITTGLVLFGLSMIFSLVPVVGGVVNTVVASLVLSGVMLGCAAQEMGEEYSLNYLFVGFARPTNIIVFSLIYVGLTYAILIGTLGSFGLDMIFGRVDAETFNATLLANRSSVMLAMGLMVPVLMATWFAIVLITLHGVSVAAAFKLSLLGTVRNLLPMLVFSVALGILFMIAVVPLLLGVLVVYPLMLISNYTAYRDIFTHEQVGTS